HTGQKRPTFSTLWSATSVSVVVVYASAKEISIGSELSSTKLAGPSDRAFWGELASEIRYAPTKGISSMSPFRVKVPNGVCNGVGVLFSMGVGLLRPALVPSR